MTTEADSYLAQVRAALADLPPVLRDDLLEDLPGHLEETLAEVGGPLERTLGTPQAYAAELRASLPDRVQEPVATSRRLDAWGQAAVRSGSRGARRVVAGLADLPYGRQLLAFLPELRPGWWVLRGYLLVALPAALGVLGLGVGVLPFLTLFRSDLLGLALTASAVVGSMRLGRRSAGLSDEGRRLVIAGNLALVALVALAGGNLRASLTPDDQFVYASDTSHLQGPDGPISNLYAFDADGRPLSGVQLFDQEGRPVDSLLEQGVDGSYTELVPVYDEYGNEVRNVFPRTLRGEVYGPAGAELQDVRPPGIVPRRLADPPTSATPTAGLSPSPSPSPAPVPAPAPSAEPAPSVEPAPSSSLSSSPAPVAPLPSPSA